MSKAKRQNKTEDFAAYLNYVLTGQVESKEQAATISKVSKRTATLSDATILAKVMLAQMDQQMTQLMEVIQVQQKVMEKLGATEEMIQAAEDEYNAQVEEMRKTLEAQAEEGTEDAIVKTITDSKTYQEAVEVEEELNDIKETGHYTVITPDEFTGKVEE